MLHNKREPSYKPLQEFWWNTDPNALIWMPWRQLKYTASVSPPVSIYCMLQFLRHALSFHGDVAEFGVFRGGSAALIAQEMQNTNKLLHLFDTFSGIPDTSEHDTFWKPGNFKDTSVQQVEEKMANYPFAVFHVGSFKDTLNKEIEFCFAHIDCDTYDAVRLATEYVYPRMSRGVIVYDDYGDKISEGAKHAVDEYYKDKRPILYIPTRQAVVIK